MDGWRCPICGRYCVSPGQTGIGSCENYDHGMPRQGLSLKPARIWDGGRKKNYRITHARAEPRRAQ